jgi:hypothetical protein
MHDIGLASFKIRARFPIAVHEQVDLTFNRVKTVKITKFESRAFVETRKKHCGHLGEAVFSGDEGR